ncbi:MAG: ribbon-helix-helix domain-containing protein [Hyphomicrobiales bacterium]|nr:ribbon-helix-helix domain-containing protein [Hyphomicrobiales bacterium]
MTAKADSWPGLFAMPNAMMGMSIMLHSAVRKRSVVINGRRTSVSLEDRFWDSLRTITKAEGLTIEAFISRINDARDTKNLSSGIRIAILEYVQQKGFNQW